jgi:mannitol/fructose-specific phosphotransferase system IIA component (Ntr-type)
MIDKLIDSALVISALESTTKSDALDEMLGAAVDAGKIAVAQRPALRKKLLERESAGSTGIGNGIAVPHLKSKKITETVLVLGRATGGIPYQAVDGRDVQTIFMVMAPEDAPDEHLKVLRWISTLARNADFRRFVQSAPDAGAIRELLREMSPS